MAFILSACAPTNYVFVKPNYQQDNYNISEVLIAIEHLSLKESFTGALSFNENVNLSNQDRLHEMAAEMLQNKGYVVADSSLKTSGFIVNRDMRVKHYYQEKIQALPISPPFIIRSVELDEATIQGLEILLAEINKPVSRVMADYKSFINNNFSAQMPALNISDDTAILMIQSYKPKNSIAGSFDVGFGVSSSSGGVYASTNNVALRPSSYAFLIHKGTGDLLWSNKISEIKPENQIDFFMELPEQLDFSLDRAN